MSSVLLIVAQFTHAQRYVPVNTFSTENGLPSNHIYDMTEDNKGFLWIATNNGVSRFDGKYFQNFLVNDGLPGNDAIQVVKEGNGRIWVNCYKEQPAYFDENINQFVKFQGDEMLKKISRSFYKLATTKEGYIYFDPHRNDVSVVLKNSIKTDTSNYYVNRPHEIILENAKYHLLWQSNSIIEGKLLLKFFEGEKLADSIVVKTSGNTKRFFLNNRFYFIGDEYLKRITVNKIRPADYIIDSIYFRFPVFRFIPLNKNKFAVITDKMIYLADENTFMINDSIENFDGANTVYLDKSNGFWLGSMDNGLVHYNIDGIKKIEIPDNYIEPNFLSIASSVKGKLFAGNYYGQLLEVSNRFFTRHTISTLPKGFWTRKVFSVFDKVITVNDHSCTIDFKYPITIQSKFKEAYSIKSGVVLNDSMVILGVVNGLVKLNINTRKYAFSFLIDRALSLVKGAGNNIYYIGPEGLYKYNFDREINVHIPLNNSFQNSKITALAFAADSTLWATTTTGSILVLKNDRHTTTISNNAGLPQNMVCVNAFKNKVWIGSKTGISVVTYSWKNKVLDYSITNISKADGLPSNAINDFAFYGDTVFAATENGIAAISFNYTPFVADIVPQLTNVKVNQQSISIASDFSFAAYQNNVALTFAGVDLTGHFLKLQYRADDDTLWNDLAGNVLNIQLYSGNHYVQVRGIDANKYVGSHILKLSFTVATPFYRQLWFLILFAFFTAGLIFGYLFYRRKKLLHMELKKKLAAEREEFEKQLAVEKAANRITADLHDDIGTRLSSINIYSNIAGQLIETDPGKTKEILIKLSSQSKSMLENLGEIIWSLKTGEDQFENIESRIKNYISDVLGVTTIDYRINIASSINEIKDVQLRKNALLIVKEAVNNAVKYSNATTITINLSIENDEMLLKIDDNGIGLNEVKSISGNGLRNMKKRAEELKGTIAINTTAGNGTNIAVRIPLADFIKG